MSLHPTLRHLCLLVSAISLLASCGGGGGAGGGGGTVAAPLTQQNAETVAERVVASMAALEGASDLGGRFTGMGGGAASRRSAGLTVSGQESCANGGTLTVSATLANPNALSANDQASVAFQNCALDLGASVIFDGAFGFQVAQASGSLDVAPFDVTLLYDFDSLQAVIAGHGTVGIDGGFSARLSSLDGLQRDAAIAATAIRVSDGAVSATLSGYVFVASRNQATGAFAVSVTGTLSSSEIGGAVTFDTLVPLTGVGDVPSAGEVLITGAGNASVLVRILSETAVELHVDENGDGTVDAVITTAWEVLEG